MTYTASTRKVELAIHQRGVEKFEVIENYDSPQKISTLMSYHNNGSSDYDPQAVRSLLAVKRDEIKHLRHQLMQSEQNINFFKD